MVKTKIYLGISMTFLLLQVPTVVQAQQEFFRGIVVDSASMNALPSVNVIIKNTVRGTTTDAEGSFSIRASRNDTLVFSLVGYETVELPLLAYEAGVIRMTQKYTLLKAVTIDEYRAGNLYEGMFDDRNAGLQRRIPFFVSKAKKEKIKVQALREENLRVKTYIDVVVNDSTMKKRMMETYSLTEAEYYDVLTAFNEKHHRVMYYLTPAELISLINTFFRGQSR